MRVGTLRLELFLPASDSLKAKRSVVNHVKERVRSRFNASIAEVGNQELWQRATMGVAIVGGESGVIHKVLQDILGCVEREDRLQVIDYDLQVD